MTTEHLQLNQVLEAPRVNLDAVVVGQVETFKARHVDEEGLVDLFDAGPGEFHGDEAGEVGEVVALQLGGASSWGEGKS